MVEQLAGISTSVTENYGEFGDIVVCISDKETLKQTFTDVSESSVMQQANKQANKTS